MWSRGTYKLKNREKSVLIHPLLMGDLKSCLVRLTRSSTGFPILDSSRRAKRALAARCCGVWACNSTSQMSDQVVYHRRYDGVGFMCRVLKVCGWCGRVPLSGGYCITSWCRSVGKSCGEAGKSTGHELVVEGERKDVARARGVELRAMGVARCLYRKCDARAGTLAEVSGGLEETVRRRCFVSGSYPDCSTALYILYTLSTLSLESHITGGQVAIHIKSHITVPRRAKRFCSTAALAERVGSLKQSRCLKLRRRIVSQDIDHHR